MKPTIFIATLRRQINLAALAIMASLLCLAVGCSRPQATTPQNQKLISSLRTAVSARNPEWLKKCGELVEERRADGQMDDAEHEEFQKILALARQNQWEEAEQETIKFQKSQRPLSQPMPMNHRDHDEHHDH